MSDIETRVKSAVRELFHQVLSNSGLHDDSLTSAAADSEAQDGHGLSFYDGASGIALFLGAYHRATQDSVAHRVALRAASRLGPELMKWLAVPNAKHQRSATPGGLRAPLSAICTLMRLGEWLNEPSLVEWGRDLLGSIHPLHVIGHNNFTVKEGCAGTLLALLSFAEEGPLFGVECGRAVDLAAICGEHLLEHRKPFRSGPRVWSYDGGPPITGFAYGAAGISYALIRLFEHTGKTEFRDAALEGFSFERTLYIPAQGTWLDLRSNRPVEETSWSHGAAGIALSRLGSLAAVDSPSLRRDLDDALNITRTVPESVSDDLSSGNAGRIEALNLAGTTLDRLHLTEHARYLAIQMAARVEASTLNVEKQSNEHNDKTKISNSSSGMYPGLAGVGYTLLRVVYPDLFPSPLLLEPQN